MENKFLTSKAANLSFQELKGGKVKGAAFQARFPHHKPATGFPAAVSTGLRG